LYGAVQRPAEYDVKVLLIHHSGELVGAHKTTFTCDGSKGTFRVMFEEPVEVQANIMYTIAATLSVSIRKERGSSPTWFRLLLKF